MMGRNLPDDLLPEHVIIVRQQLHHAELNGGLTLVAEKMDRLHSVAVRILIPAGSIYDPAPKRGLSNVLTEMMDRGAGTRNSRQISDVLESLGVDHSIGSGTHTISLSATLLAENLEPALELLADIIMRPRLPARELAAVKDLVSQDIQALEEEPRKQVMMELSRHYFPSPYGNDPRGTMETVESINMADLEKFHTTRVQPKGAIVAVAGKIQFGKVEEILNRVFEEWKPGKTAVVKPGKTGKSVSHVVKDSEQTHIALAFPSVPVGHEDYYGALGLVGVLSGGMSGRLFTEVREKRGLCYACWATYAAVKEHAAIKCYAGSTTARAQETLEVLVGEIRRASKNLTEDEIDRVRIGMRTSLFKQEDSSSARAYSLANDWFNLARIRPVEELEASVAGISIATIRDYLKKHPPQPVTLVSMGREALDAGLLAVGK